ncbi:MAG: helix-turn-helix domain-containing protein, partial [Chloroflexota bacterium]
TRQVVQRAALERVSLPGIERVFGVCRQTVVQWIKDHVWTQPLLVETLVLFFCLNSAEVAPTS